MEIYAKAFCLQKRGNRESDYEDACSISGDKTRFAVADGASEASFSGEWATQLVRAFKQRKISVPVTLDELKPLQDRWKAKIVNRRILAWYAEEKAGAGAFAAFAGLELSQEKSKNGLEKIWRATAAGDSCLVQIRDNQILKAFPLADSASFNNRPDLLCSLPIFNNSGNGLVKATDGSWGCDDVFFLMTDALACWFFKEYESGNQPWQILRDLDTSDQVSFEKFISDARSENRIKNDDVTLVRIDIIA